MNQDSGKIQVGAARRAEFETLFREFLDSYPHTEEGRRHAETYEASRRQGRANFEEILRIADLGEDVTDAVLLRLLPYDDTSANREKGAWAALAPAIQGDLRKWYEGRGWTDPRDWPRVAEAILDFVRTCYDNPQVLGVACKTFDDMPYTTGFQAGMLTPILNALRPEDFLLINKKSRETVNHFAGTSHSQRLRDYPAANATGWALIRELAPLMHRLEVPKLTDSDLLDMFSHWLVAVRRFDFKPVRYWKIAPGENAWNWAGCRDGGFIAIGWDPLGDVSELTRVQFDAKRDELVATHDDWTKADADQVWRFARIDQGDRIVANRGMSEILGIGHVTGPYYFVEDERHAHRLPVEWVDVTHRRLDKEEQAWGRTLVELDRGEFEEIRKAPAIESDPVIRRGEPTGVGYFTARTLELLEGLHRDPTVAYYREHRDAFQKQLIVPFRRLFQDVAERLPAAITDMMETERRVFSRIPKNDFGRGGAWPWYWGALYPKGSKRTDDAQLLLSIDHRRLAFGFFIADYATERRQEFVERCREAHHELVALLGDVLSDDDLVFDLHEGIVLRPDGCVDSELDLTWQEWLEHPDRADFAVSVVLPWAEVLTCSEETLAGRIAQTYERLFPLVLLSVEEDPLGAIAAHLQISDPVPERNPVYSLEDCAAETHVNRETLEAWVRAIERKKQAILYGPPGTGKTYLAEHLARHLVGDGDGFSEVVQFHPAYAYEDFVQGLRPEPAPDAGLQFDRVPGRFLDFCRRARSCDGRCVLIIDEINRAHLSRVFGELMYLLEYRGRDVPLAAGGRFRIPANVRLIGTMNTADRSIALVDHALRRRFAFLALYPDYDLLRRYHSSHRSGFDVEPLVQVLGRVNREIGDPHYAVGITFFLLPDLSSHIEDIWRMEIEPYLEEYFFDQPDKVAAFHWPRIRDDVLP